MEGSISSSALVILLLRIDTGDECLNLSQKFSFNPPGDPSEGPSGYQLPHGVCKCMVDNLPYRSPLPDFVDTDTDTEPFCLIDLSDTDLTLNQVNLSKSSPSKSNATEPSTSV